MLPLRMNLYGVLIRIVLYYVLYYIMYYPTLSARSNVSNHSLCICHLPSRVINVVLRLMCLVLDIRKKIMLPNLQRIRMPGDESHILRRSRHCIALPHRSWGRSAAHVAQAARARTTRDGGG